MRNYMSFIKKEFLEYSRTYKVLILGMVFFIFGVMGPITAKMMPDLMASFMPKGATLNLPEPSAIDAWAQFFKNIPQMGLFVLVILFGGILSSEISKGTLVIVLTKGLSRNTVIASKFTAMVCMWTFGYLIAALTSLGYTLYLFPNSTVHHTFFALFLLWVFGVFIVSALLFSASATKNIYGTLIGTGLMVAIMTLLNIIPTIQKYVPLHLAGKNLLLMSNKMVVNDFIPALCVTLVGTLLFLTGAILLFRKRQL